MHNRVLENDVIFGVFRRYERNLTSLTDREIMRYAKQFASIEYFMQGDDDKIIVLRFI